MILKNCFSHFRNTFLFWKWNLSPEQLNFMNLTNLILTPIHPAIDSQEKYRGLYGCRSYIQMVVRLLKVESMATFLKEKKVKPVLLWIDVRPDNVL